MEPPWKAGGWTHPRRPDIFVPMRIFFSLVGVVLIIGGLGACSVNMDWERAVDRRGQFWERADSTSTVFMEGPKAQQMLNRDISRCVVELRELQRLGMVKASIPIDQALDATFDPQKHLEGWDAPLRDGALLNEPIAYTDFESCMVYKGWRRVKFVPYDTFEKSKATYLNTHGEARNR